jgi:transcriptional regulator with XRE-family HTH domain
MPPRAKDEDELGEMLKMLRRKARLTQEELAGLAAVSVRTIRGIELGRVQRPRLETVRLIGDALQLSGSRRSVFERAATDAATTGGAGQTFDLGQAVPPVALGPFLGRQPEMHALIELLDTESERLVSVVGVSGVGKTRLVLEAVHQLHDATDVPVTWVGVGTSATSAAQAVGADQIREAIVSGDKYDEFSEIIGTDPALLVLDGCEALPVHAPLNRLLNACPQLSVVVTSREPCAGLGGRVLPLAPLSTAVGASPGDAATTDQPAVALMMSYLRYLRPDIPQTESVTDCMAYICQALDGLPQALESAASWLPLYAPGQLRETAAAAPLALTLNLQASSSDTVSNFQHSLQWSVARLAPDHSRLLKAMAGEEAPWTVGALAAEAECTRAEALRGLHALILRGLVRPVHHEEVVDSADADFTVLNLVRHVIDAEDGRPVLDDIADDGRNAVLSWAI